MDGFALPKNQEVAMELQLDTELDIRKLRQKAYCWDFDHNLDHRDGLDLEDDLSWLDDLEEEETA
jgi:hypothetical protein